MCVCVCVCVCVLQGTPPPVKKIKLEVVENESMDDSKKPVPIKKSHLNLDDLPPELLPKHQECIKKQVRGREGDKERGRGSRREV